MHWPNKMENGSARPTRGATAQPKRPGKNDLGTIEAGKLADLVILSDNIFEIVPEKIIDTKVIMTIVGVDINNSDIND